MGNKIGFLKYKKDKKGKSKATPITESIIAYIENCKEPTKIYETVSLIILYDLRLIHNNSILFLY